MKIKSFMLAHKATVNSVITSTCLVGATAGIVFGVSAGTFTVRYMDLGNADNRLAASQVFGTSYYSEDIGSDWNMYAKTQSDGTVIPGLPMPRNKDITSEEGKQWWKANHPGAEKFLFVDKTAYGLDIPFGTEFVSPADDSKIEKRYNYSAMIIDGASHTTMDRSFNQSLYSGLVDFNHNYIVDHLDSETSEDFHLNIAHSHKPSQDNDTAFMDMYKAAARDYSVIGLAGFNHASPLQKLMVNKDAQGNISPLAYNPDQTTNKTLNETGFVLLDSNISNNQTIASVQFRSDQPGFLAGMSTCQYFMNNLDLYHNEFQPLSVGLFGGVQIPSVIVYMGGFQRGIEFFNEFALNTAVLTNGASMYFDPELPRPTKTEQINVASFEGLVEHSKYKSDIEDLKQLPVMEAISAYEYTYHQKLLDEFSVKVIKLGDAGTHFSGTFAAGDAIGITKQYLNRGASAIVAVAGPQSLDAAQEIQNQNSKCIVIGVDTAMEDGDYQRFHNGCGESSRQEPVLTDPFMDKTEAPDGSVSQQTNAIIKFSAVKDIRTVTRNIDFLCANGQLWDNDARMWEHIYEPRYDEDKTLTLSLENCNIEEIVGNADKRVRLVSLNLSAIPDVSKYESIIIPAILYDGRDTLTIGEIGNGVDPCFDFQSKQWPNLKNICIDSRYSGGFRINSNAFKNDSDVSQKPHVICFDFPNLVDNSKINIVNNAFTGDWNTNDGMICLNSDMPAEEKGNFENKLKNAGLSKWAQVAPSPSHAICGPGFQTCGNIQNGLISISWDGFYPLLCVLSQLRFDLPSSGSALGLFDTLKPDGTVTKGAWHIVADQYLNDHQDESIDSRYKEKIVNVENLFTFKRADDAGETYMFDNFNHTISILGMLLQDAKFDFYTALSLFRDENGDLRKGVSPLEHHSMSILDWLTTNMYLLS